MTTRATRSPRRRTVVALAVVLAILAAFVVRLVDIQVVNADDHRADSLGLGMGTTLPLYGVRGEILDANGQVLAGNVIEYDAAIDPYNVATQEPDDDRTAIEVWPEQAAAIAAVIGQDPAEVQALADPAHPDESRRWAQLAKGLSTAEYRALAELGLGFVTFTRHPVRTYPDGAIAGNLIGFVGSDGTPLAGLEVAENSCLVQTDGEQSYERGKDGVIIPGTQREVPAVDGGHLQLTIDRDLQWYMQQLIAEQVQDQQAQYGTIFVVEVKSGKVRAAAEYPTVDPNDVLASPAADRGSRIFSAQFEPGSTFKPITAATIIEEGKATPTTPVIPAAGREELNGITINDVFAHPSYDYTLTGALIDSSNVALSKFGDLVTEDVRREYLKRFGVSTPTAIGFPDEAAGMLPETPWDDASHWATTFGQAYTVTIPQLSSAWQTIANGGERLPLRLIESCTAADGTVVEPELPGPERIISESTADQVTAMLENVYAQNGNHRLIELPGYRAATKTGTAQKPDGQGGYKRGVYYTTMIGFAPAEDPEYVVLLSFDEPLKTRLSGANAPGWQKAMTHVLKHYRVLPSTTEAEILPKFG